jgi:hypothetical protein
VPRSSRCRAPSAGRGQAPRYPRATWHPQARTPTFSFLFSPLPRCHRAARSPLALLHSSSHLHSSPTPPLERPSLPTAPRTRTPTSSHRQPLLPHGFWPSTAAVRHSPVSSSPSCQSLQFLAIFLTPLPLRCCRTPHPPSPPTGAPSPPTNAATRRRLHRLTVDPLFRCAPTRSSLLDTFPVTHLRSPATPCRRRANAEPPVSTPPRRPAHILRVVTAPARARYSRPCRPVAPLGWAARSWPDRRFGPVSARYGAGDFKCFSNYFK